MCLENNDFVPFASSLPGFFCAGPLLHALSKQAVFNFHSQWQNKLCHSISFQTPWIVLAGDDQPLTIQPNDQAGDQP